MKPSHNRWWERPNRVLLINLREGDEPRIDARALVRDAQSFAATAFCINGGGIVAFYQTTIPGHRLSSGLNGRDLLAEVIPLAHEAGLRVLARIDPSCAPKALAAEHPEWFSRDREGRFCEVSDHYVTCPNAGYYHERMVEIASEILSRYDADGIWNNQGKFAAWDTGPCHCDTCQRLFRHDASCGLPREENWQDPAWRKYNEWRYRRIVQWVKRMHEAIHAAKPEAVFISAIQLIESLETIRPGGWDIDYWVDHQDVLTFECQRRNTAPWWPGIQAKYLSSLAPQKPRWMTASYFYPWWRLHASPAEENRPWIAQQFANGVCTWLHINGGYSELFDRRGLAPMREVLARHARWEQYFDGAASDARVALVFSRHTQDNYGADKPHARYLDYLRGWYCALQEAHIPFDVISDKLLTGERLQRYRALVISNLACVSDESVRVLDDFVAAGGALIASYEAGFRDLDGERRTPPAFAPMLGGAYEGHRDNLKSSYAKLEDRADPLLAGLGDTDLIPNEGALVEFRPASGSSVPLTLIPPVIAHSGATISIPEYSAIKETTAIPVAVRTHHGHGRVVYFPNQMECLYYRYGFRDLGLVLGNAVRYALGDAHHVEVAAPDFVDLSLMRQGERRLVHLINLPVDKPLDTGWRHPGRNLVPVTGIEVTLRIEGGQRVREVRAATSEQQLTFIQEGDWARVRAPRLEDHEIMVFEID
ncbi:MAG: beta-galactosidase trimerization domain-containing protein [Betaproteobacteria bacterium]|nr:beta-galactosidase trimerization domain-containing protein [Betaproteobacteria bacterium]